MQDRTREYDLQSVAERSHRYPVVGALHLVMGEIRGRMVLLDSNLLKIGRDASCDLRFEIEGLSRSHAVIERDQAGRYLLSDLRSTNGTFVNGQQIEDRLLKDGDRLALGPNLVFCFRSLQLDEALALEAMTASSARDVATGAITGTFFEEMLQAQLELGQRRNFDVALLWLQWSGFREVYEEHRVVDLYRHLESLEKPGSLTARLGPRVFAQSHSYVARQEVERCLAQLEAKLQDQFSDSQFLLGVAYSREMATPQGKTLIQKASRG